MADAGPSHARRTAWISFLAGLAMFGADRLHKYIQIDLFGWAGGEHVRVLPFFDYMYVRNFGVSYGLLSGVPWYVIAVIIALAMALLIGWWIKATSLRLRLALALCLGGAASNAIDRVLYGSVADFFYLHAGQWSFYVFNLADVAITAGAILLIADLLFAPASEKKA